MTKNFLLTIPALLSDDVLDFCCEHLLNFHIHNLFEYDSSLIDAKEIDVYLSFASEASKKLVKDFMGQLSAEIV